MITQPHANGREAPRAPLQGDVLVLGAGLAGAATAAALASYGYRVIVIDTPSVPAASTVPLALMAPYPTPALDPLTRLRGRGLATTRAWLARLERAGLDSGRRLDGVLLIPARPRDRQRRDRLVETERTRRLTPDEALAYAGARPPEATVFHAHGACVDPPAFGEALLRSAGTGIQRLQAEASDLRRRHGRWEAFGPAGDPLASAPCVVVAAGYGSTRFAPDAAEQLTPLRGQATAVAATAKTEALRYAVSHGGYILPAVNGVHWVGATATRDDTEGRPRDADDGENVQRLHQLWPEFEPSRVLDRFVAIRATTGSRLPLVGALGNGMWINTGHGSHGLLTAPLAGRLIASGIARSQAHRMMLKSLQPNKAKRRGRPAVGQT